MPLTNFNPMKYINSGIPANLSKQLIITDENTFSEDQLQFMWSSNYHIYFYNN